MHDQKVLCDIARSMAEDVWMNVAYAVQVLLCSTMTAIALYIVASGKITKTIAHVNIKIIFANVAVMYCVFCSPLVANGLWRLIDYHTYTNPCQLLVPPWVSVVVRGPFYLFLVGCPCWHLVATLERSYATFRAESYEKMSASYGIWSSIVVWTISIAYAAYIVYLAFMSHGFQNRTYYIGLTTSTSADFVLHTHYVTLVVDLITFLLDCVVLHWNRQKLKRIFPSYSLSRSYQTNENVIVTTRLMLPLSFTNSVLYVTYLGLSTWIRFAGYEMAPHREESVYEWIGTVLMLQMLISVIIFLRFSNHQGKAVNIAKKSEENDLYFKQFGQLW
ncbi:hypothetical protein AAVH_18669 [Aphelenchoides avenae]|nr:hypothetical protein AAVH_18669 [Aphelenchus avenae]